MNQIILAAIVLGLLVGNALQSGLTEPSLYRTSKGLDEKQSLKLFFYQLAAGLSLLVMAYSLIWLPRQAMTEEVFAQNYTAITAIIGIAGVGSCAVGGFLLLHARNKLNAIPPILIGLYAIAMNFLIS